MQTIYLDISNRGVIPAIYAKQGDVGRKVEVVLTNSGLPYEPEAGSAFSAWYSGASGVGNYTEIGGRSAFSVSGNEVTVELITQMLQNSGEGFLCLVLSRLGGEQIGMWNIRYICEEVPGAGSQTAKDYYTAFSKAVEGLSNPNLNIESPECAGCYYRVVGGKIEWINPPMFQGVEYRTTERNNGSPVYVKRIAYKLGSINASNAVVNSLVPHGISNWAYLVRAHCAKDSYVLPYLKDDGGFTSIASVDSANITLRAYKATWAEATWLIDLYYVKY